MAAVQTALGSALIKAMAPYAAKVEALEKAAKPPLANRRREPVGPPATAPTAQTEGLGIQVTPTHNPPHANAPPHRDPDFILVSRQNKGKGKEATNATGRARAQPTQPTAAPPSFANAASSATNIQQPQPTRKEPKTFPSITEVTVLRKGGFHDKQVEAQVQSRAADAIVREVRIKMAKTVAKPIPLRAGRWSIHPRSKGNFVFSFEGSIPFDLIQSYERLLLEPFLGSGELCPSMGWARFVVNGVPIWDDETHECYPPEALLAEVRMMPGLKKATFAMQPRWLKPLDEEYSLYSSITFALSDPNGSTTGALLNGRAALFGKEVTVRKWVDKPALIQCSQCHALGHNKSSKTCLLNKDSVKCYKCGGAHKSELHDQLCTRKHTVVGICDCQHFKCLNCHNRGHNCRDVRCPSRDLYRPRGGKGKTRATEPPTGPNENASSGPSQPPRPPNAPQTTLTQVDFDRMEDYEREESERMEWEHDQGRLEAHNNPLVYAVPILDESANTQEPQHRDWSPSQPPTNNTPLTHD